MSVARLPDDHLPVDPRGLQGRAQVRPVSGWTTVPITRIFDDIAPAPAGGCWFGGAPRSYGLRTRRMRR